MLSFSPRSLLAIGLGLAVVLYLHGETPPSKPTAKQIAQWVEQLGDNDFTARENASKKLWQAGAAAESALEKALKSDDPEVVRRARELLDKFRWGIYPDTPGDIVALIRAYQSSVGDPGQEVFQKLLDSGDAGFRAIRKIVAAEKDEDQRKKLGNLIANKLPGAFLQAVTSEKYEYFERLLELGHHGKFTAHTQYAAYWLLRGKLPEAITRFAAKLREHPEDTWAAQTLAYLHRANGDLVEARKAAEKSGRVDLLEGILSEAGDWKALAARAEKTTAAKPADKGAYDIAGVENMIYRAAYTRLARKQKEFDNAVRELRRFVEGKGEGKAWAFVAAKALLLNDRPAEGMDLLRTLSDRPTEGTVTIRTLSDPGTLLFDTLCTRLEFARAMDFTTKEASNDKDVSRLKLARARALCLLGENKEGEALFDRWAEAIKDGVDPDWVQALLAEEMRAGLKDRTFAHTAKALSVSPPKNRDYRSKEEPAQVYFAQLFPQQTTVARVWWAFLRQCFKDEPPAAVMKRLCNLLEGKVASQDVRTWVEQAEPLLSRLALLKVNAAEKRQALAETAAKAGLDELAASLLEKAESRDALLRLGDLLAAKKQWAKAAERYQQARKKELLSEPALSLYLAGDALIHAGQEKEGKKLVEQAHWLPLADAATRLDLLRALTQRGHSEAAQRETELVLRISEPNSYQAGEALRRRAFAAQKHKEYLKTAKGFEQSMLRCLHPNVYFVSNAAYVNVPAQIHQLRAQGLLAAGKLDKALKQADLALAVSPGYINLPIALVPELERLGHKKEAETLFNRCYGPYEKVCRSYPRCAWAHNSLAWMSACCRRNLDKGLQHAEKAVELAPTNAGYLDTLAEIHFQRGDKDKAIASQKRAIELDPKRAYYRKQLKRLEAGDPSAERLPDDDD